MLDASFYPSLVSIFSHLPLFLTRLSTQLGEQPLSAA